MRYPRSLLALASALALCACATSASLAPRVVLSPPVVDLQRPPEPVEPDPATADEAAYDRYDDAVLAWGRAMYDQLGRLADWVAGNEPKP